MIEFQPSRRGFLLHGSVAGAWTLLGGSALQALARVSSRPGDLSGIPGTTDPALSGNFAPVLDELDATDLPVEGQIPPALRGTYFRNGPNPVYPPTPYHWFDGDGMVHAISLKDGKASYRNRFVQTEGLLRERAAGKSLYGGLLAGPPFKNAANISIVHHHGKTLATWEGGQPYEIDPSSLGTIGAYDFAKQWPGPFTAHPKQDPSTGELVIFGYDLTPPYLRYGVLDTSGHLIHSADIELPGPVMMHDFAITERYTLFLDLPVVFFPHGPSFSPSAGARIGVVPRFGQNTDVRWFDVEPCWVYHVLNAFEDGNQLVLRACRYPDFPKSPAVLHEWRLDLSTGKAVERALDQAITEFPIVNPSRVGQYNRYGFAGLSAHGTSDGIVKYDLESGTQKTFSFGQNKMGGETFFVPTAGASSEDSGFLLSIVTDTTTASVSRLLILDAQSLNQLAAIRIPRRVPFGIHGSWLPEASSA